MICSITPPSTAPRPLHVHFSRYTVGGEVVLAVRDNGGLGLANEPCLFAMFQRLQDHVEGSGMVCTR